MKTFFHQLFDYNYFCNKHLIEACAGLDSPPGRSGELFSHLLNAHHIWNARIIGIASALEVWQLHEPGEWEDIHYDNQRNSFEIITNADSFDTRIAYETTEGRAFANSLQDILFHIVNHSTHHRGQIAQEFRGNGQQPLVFDYIHYKR